MCPSEYKVGSDIVNYFSQLEAVKGAENGVGSLSLNPWLLIKFVTDDLCEVDRSWPKTADGCGSVTHH